MRPLKIALLLAAFIACLPIFVHAQSFWDYNATLGVSNGLFQARLDALNLESDSLSLHPKDFTVNAGFTAADVVSASRFGTSVTLRQHVKQQYLRFGFVHYRAPVVDTFEYVGVGKRSYTAAQIGATYAPVMNDDFVLLCRYGLNLGAVRYSIPEQFGATPTTPYRTEDRWKTGFTAGPSFDFLLQWRTLNDDSWGIDLGLQMFISNAGVTDHMLEGGVTYTGNAENFPVRIGAGFRMDSNTTTPFMLRLGYSF